jgi:acetoin utilization deacetylase AcuC-like enzyme
MTQVLMEIADVSAKGRIVLTLEGGYDVSAQTRSVKAVLKELARASQINKEDLLEKEKACYSRIERLVLQIKEIQKKYWKNL